MTNVSSLVDSLSAKHILTACSQSYRQGFVAAVLNVYSAGTLQSALQHKFFIPDDSQFTLDKFLQHAAELTVQNHIKGMSVSRFAIEKNINPSNDTDVDVYYESHSARVALEVKCASEPVKETGTLFLNTAGRIRDYDETYNDLKKLIETGDPTQTLVRRKNKDNTLKDFLVSAHEKFSPDSGVDDVNILFVACGDHFDIMQWHNFLYAPGGLFTGNPFYPSTAFKMVDAVILSNLKYLHSVARDFHDWTLKNAFILPLVNPHGRVSLLSQNLIAALAVFNHHLKRFRDYKLTAEDIQVPEEALDALKVLHYIAEHIPTEEKLRYFPVWPEKEDE